MLVKEGGYISKKCSKQPQVPFTTLKIGESKIILQFIYLATRTLNALTPF